MRTALSWVGNREENEFTREVDEISLLNLTITLNVSGIRCSRTLSSTMRTAWTRYMSKRTSRKDSGNWPRTCWRICFHLSIRLPWQQTRKDLAKYVRVVQRGRRRFKRSATKLDRPNERRVQKKRKIPKAWRLILPRRAKGFAKLCTGIWGCLVRFVPTLQHIMYQER